MRTKKIHVYDFLRAPGAGLLTVSTGGSQKELKKYFPEVMTQRWSQVLRERFKDFKKSPPPFFLLGIPSDSGGGICRGAAHGPAHLRLSFFEKHPEWKNYDLGDVPCIPQLVTDSMLNDKQIKMCREDLFGSARVKWPVSPLDLANLVYQNLRTEFPHVPLFVLGGDHSVSYPCFEALRVTNQFKGLAVLHIDAHTDLLYRRFGVEVCFGTWTARILENFPQPKNWVQVGIRTSQKPKRYWEKKLGIQQFWAHELNKKDPQDFAQELILKWRSLGCDKLYVTHDIDGTDDKYVASTGTPEPEGLKPEWIKALLKNCSKALPLVGADLVEVAPVLGSEKSIRQTLKVARSYAEALIWK